MIVAVEVVVVGAGMMTPVGLSAPETAASARSRTARIAEIDWYDRRFRNFVVGAVPEDGLPDLDAEVDKQLMSARESRMLRLADPPLQEALAVLPKTAAPVPLILGLPEFQTRVPLKPVAFIDRLVAQTKARVNPAKSVGLLQGRSAGLLAVKEACDRLQQQTADFALAGGVDSLVDLYVLGTLDLEKRVRNDVNGDGFTPGEGAGFVLLTTAESAQRYGMTVWARVPAAASGHEPGHVHSDEPYKGDGLAQTFEALFNAADSLPPVASIYASFNGERYWAKELGVSVLRHKPRFQESYRLEHPAECCGDLGAAIGPVMLGLASLGIRDGYRRGPALVYASSDLGARAAVVVSQ